MRGLLSASILVLLLSLFVPFGGVVYGEPAAYFAETGFAVDDGADARFLSEFKRFGGVDVLGYPASKPYEVGGFRYQVFQRAILQWRPELGRAVFANTFDWLSDLGKDAWLDSLGISRRLADSGGSWGQIVAEREGWLTEPAIARAYRSGGGMERFGLPQSRPERRGPFVVQRFQRVAFQLWLDRVDNAPPPGSVVGILAGDIAKQAGIVPTSATTANSQVISAAGDPAGASIVSRFEAEQVAINLINQSRSNHGLPLVLMDGALQKMARDYAVEMAARNFFSHTNPDGRTLGDRFGSSVAPGWSIGLENLGWGAGYGSPSDSVRSNHEMMMAEIPPDDGHRRNILNVRVRKVGIGVVQRASDGKVYYTSEFTD